MTPARHEYDASGTITVGLALLPDFPLMAYSAAVEPLRAANTLAGRALYRWWHASPRGEAVHASQGLAIQPEAALPDSPAADRVFVCAGGNASAFNDERCLAWLRRLGRAPVDLGGISGGPFVLARAGLLDGRRCTLHWEHIPAFSETFPAARVQRSLFEIDGHRITCSGGIAALDMTLDLIARDFGRSLARAVSDWFLHNQMREGPSPQRMTFALRFDVHDERIARVLDAVERNLEAPLTHSRLAALVDMSERHLQRLFRATVGISLHDFAMHERLAHARRLRRETTMRIEEVAQATGFRSATELRRVERRYRRRAGSDDIASASDDGSLDMS